MGRVEVKKEHTLIGHNDSIYTLEAIDNHRFLSAGGDGMVVLWDVSQSEEAGEVIARVDGSVYAVAYDRDHHLVYVGQNNDGIHVIDFVARKEIGSIHLGNDQIFDIKIHLGKIWVALSSGEVVILNARLQVEKRVKLANERARSIDFSASEVSIAFSDNIIRILDPVALKVHYELMSHSNSVFTSRFHPSGKYLISGGRDAHIKVWDTQAGYILRESIPAHLYTINHIVFSPNGKYFVTGSMDKAIKLWDAYNFKLLKVLDKQRHAAHGNSVNRLLWMNFRDLLVTCSDDRTISVWDLKIEE